ncbi:MAG: biopolymer transporter ExbD [Spirochaetaceae bacterium]|nr:biopolymer transporter ExbD [Spirochaetaceae bacterium]
MKLRRPRRAFFIPLNAMSDVAFLLLIFIMLVSLMNYRRKPGIEYPEAETAARVNGGRNFEIWIERTGASSLNGVPASLGDIELALAGLYVTAPGTMVHIIADRNTPFTHVQGVIAVLQRLQYRAVSFVVKDG